MRLYSLTRRPRDRRCRSDKIVMSNDPQPAAPASVSELAQPATPVADGSLRWQEHTPARLWTGRAGVSYRTATALELRRDHAAAVDAVYAELDVMRDLGADFVRQFGLFELSTETRSKTEYLARPDMGRRFNSEAKDSLWKRCPRGAGLQVVIGDGLSATAIAAQIPTLLPAFLDTASNRGWQIGQPFVVRHCRVGVLNDIGEQLDPQVVVLGVKRGSGRYKSCKRVASKCGWRLACKAAPSDRSRSQTARRSQVTPSFGRRESRRTRCWPSWSSPMLAAVVHPCLGFAIRAIRVFPIRAAARMAKPRL